MIKKLAWVVAAIAAGTLVGSDPRALMKSVASAVRLSNPDNGMSITLLSPVAGSTISNTIKLRANVTSLTNPIARVEFYCDGVLIATKTNADPSIPKNVKIAQR